MLSILAMLAMPTYHYLITKSESEIAESQVLRMIAIAQKTAMNKRVPVIICKSKNFIQCDGEARDGVLIAIRDSNDHIISEGNIIFAQQMAHGVLHWQSFPRYRDYIVFKPTGLLDNDNATFWFCLSQQTSPAFAVRLGKSGHTRVDYPSRHHDIKDSKKRILNCDLV